MPTIPTRRRRTKRQKLLPRPDWAKHCENTDPVTDERIIELWSRMLRTKADDLYYRRSSWEALATVASALVVGLLLVWFLVR